MTSRTPYRVIAPPRICTAAHTFVPQSAYGEDDTAVAVEELLQWKRSLEPTIAENEQTLRR